MLSMVLLSLLGAVALASEPATTWQPPAEDGLVERWRQTTMGLVGGPGASAIFRDAATDLDVHWRLAAFDGTAPPMNPERSKELVDLAVIGAGLGWELTARRMISNVANPGKKRTGRADEAIRQRNTVAFAELDDPQRQATQAQALQTPRTPVKKQHRPVVRPGAAVTMRTSVDPSYWENRSLAEAAAVSTWLQARHLGPDVLRVQMTTHAPEENGKWPVKWGLAARQQLAPRISAVAEVHGKTPKLARLPPPPERLRGAIDVHLQQQGPWYLRAEATQARLDDNQGLERRVAVRLRARMGWRVPAPESPWCEMPAPPAPRPEELAVAELAVAEPPEETAPR
jgi:hypothetical protein